MPITAPSGFTPPGPRCLRPSCRLGWRCRIRRNPGWRRTRSALTALLALALLACGGGSGGGAGGAGGTSAGGVPVDSGGTGGAGAGGGTTKTDSQAFCDAGVGEELPGGPRLSLAIQPVGTPARRESPCVVVGQVDDIRFRIVLPEHWNGEIHMFGGGGFNGRIPDLPIDEVLPPTPSAILVGTDGGHSAQPFDASWTLGNEAAIQAFADGAVHRVIGIAKRFVFLR